MKLWLDDIRPAPEGWYWARSVDVATLQLFFERDNIEEASLDHDLGDFSSRGGDGIKLVDWFCETNHWPTSKITIHSGNPVGRDNMMRAIKRFGPYNKFTYNSASFEEQ